MGHLNRRRFLQSSAALAGSVTFFKNVEALNGYANTPTIRKNASVMAANDPVMIGYRRAVAAMKNLPDNNPCSWFYQSAIHGTTVTPVQTAWNSCHLDSRFFWAWHRMYLYWFERIIRKYSGMYDWAIPYWHWTSSDPDQRKIPAPLRITNSTLYDSTRNASLNSGSTGIASFYGSSVQSAFSNTNYFTAQSGVEGPHGGIHVSVSGNMGSTLSAAKDPLFYLHHSEVDRQWNQWLAQGGRSNPVNDASWRGQKYTFFDECCNAIEMSVCQILRAAKQLGYVYEDEPPQVNQYCPLIPIIDVVDIDWIRLVDIGKFNPISIGGRPYRQAVGNRTPANINRIKSQREEFKSLRRKNGSEHDVVLRLKGIETELHPDTSYQVYLGPEGLEPDPDSRYFLGAFGLFSSGIKEKKHHYRPAEYAFPVSDRLLRDMRRKDYEVMVVPTSGLDNEKRLERDVKVKTVIQSISIEAIQSTPQPDKDEQEKLRIQEDPR